MHSGAGQALYRSGKSERVRCDGMADTLRTWKGELYPVCGCRAPCTRRGTVRRVFARCDGSTCLMYVIGIMPLVAGKRLAQ